MLQQVGICFGEPGLPSERVITADVGLVRNKEPRCLVSALSPPVRVTELPSRASPRWGKAGAELRSSSPRTGARGWGKALVLLGELEGWCSPLCPGVGAWDVHRDSGRSQKFWSTSYDGTSFQWCPVTGQGAMGTN